MGDGHDLLIGRRRPQRLGRRDGGKFRACGLCADPAARRQRQQQELEGDERRDPAGAHAAHRPLAWLGAQARVPSALCAAARVLGTRRTAARGPSRCRRRGFPQVAGTGAPAARGLSCRLSHGTRSG